MRNRIRQTIKQTQRDSIKIVEAPLKQFLGLSLNVYETLASNMKNMNENVYGSLNLAIFVFRK